MPIGEIIGEVFLRPIFELIFYGLSYWTGFLVLKSCSLGGIRLASLEAFHVKNRGKRKWYQIDWSIWLDLPRKGRVLKAECVCLVGIVVWIGLGIGIYLVGNGEEALSKEVELKAPTGNHQRIAP